MTLKNVIFVKFSKISKMFKINLEVSEVVGKYEWSLQNDVEWYIACQKRMSDAEC